MRVLFFHSCMRVLPAVRNNVQFLDISWWTWRLSERMESVTAPIETMVSNKFQNTTAWIICKGTRIQLESHSKSAVLMTSIEDLYTVYWVPGRDEWLEPLKERSTHDINRAFVHCLLSTGKGWMVGATQRAQYSWHQSSICTLFTEYREGMNGWSHSKSAVLMTSIEHLYTVYWVPGRDEWLEPLKERSIHDINRGFVHCLLSTGKGWMVGATQRAQYSWHQSRICTLFTEYREGMNGWSHSKSAVFMTSIEHLYTVYWVPGRDEWLEPLKERSIHDINRGFVHCLLSTGKGWMVGAKCISIIWDKWYNFHGRKKMQY